MIRVFDADTDAMMRDIIGGGQSQNQNMNFLRMNDIQHLMILIFDWRKSYAEGPIGGQYMISRRNRLWTVIISSTKRKEGIKNIQDFFGGRKISRYTRTIDDTMANEYLSYVMEELQKMMDPRIKPSRIK
jgi:hypothetical protein